MNQSKQLRGVAVLLVVALLAMGSWRLSAQPAVPTAAEASATAKTGQTQSVTLPIVSQGTPQQAVAVTSMPSPAAPPHAVDQITWALIVSYLLNYIKKSKWFPWLSETSTARLKTQIGFLTALLTAAGVHFAVTGSIYDGVQGAAITISGLSLGVIKDVAFQWATQQGFYDALVNNRSTAPGLSQSAPA